MKHWMLTLILSGLFFTLPGCGGGGSGNGVSLLYTIPVNMSYTVNSSSTSSTADTTTMTITTIDVRSDNTIKVNCIWTSVNKSGNPIYKLSDQNKTSFYMADNTGKTYNHTSGDGAAYSQTLLSASAVTGAYYFPVFQSGTTSIYFYDANQSQTLGPIKITQ